MSSIRLKHASGNSMSLAAPGTNPASNLELKLPHTIGSANQLLKVDGSGQLGWADDNSGLSLSNDANNRVVTGTGSGLNAEANLTFNGNQLSVTTVGSDDPLLVNATYANRKLLVRETGDGNSNTGITIQKKHSTLHPNGYWYGDIRFEGWDGDQYRRAALIECVAEGTPANDNMPGQLRIHTNPGQASQVERIRITKDGSVNIGGNYTQTTDRLQVDGTIRGSNVKATAAFYADGNANTALQLHSTGTTGQSRIFFGDASTFQAGKIIYDHTSDYMYFGTGGSGAEKVRITSGGRIGINYAAQPPSETIHISQASGHSAGSVSLSHTSGGNRYGARLSSLGSTDAGLAISSFFNSAYTERLRISSSGALGVSHNLTGTSNYNRLMLHNPHDGSCWMQLTSTATGSSANTDGLSIGLNTSNVAHIWQRENASLDFGTNGTQRLRITSGGSVNIGTTGGYAIWNGLAQDVNVKLEVRCTVGEPAGMALLEERGDSNAASFIIGKSRYGSGVGAINSGDSLGWIKFSGADGTRQHNAAGILAYNNGTVATGRVAGNLGFYTAPDSVSGFLSRLVINSKGDVAMGEHKSDTLWDSTSENGWYYRRNEGSLAMANNTGHGYSLMYMNKNTTGGNNDSRYIDFYWDAYSRGSITGNGSNTAYNTSSDYRLKENIIDITDGITRLKQLKPRRFNWIADSTNTVQDGFIAHEVSSFIPEAVTGTKDRVVTQSEVDANTQPQNDEAGTPIYQQMDYAKVTPLLTAALQEAITKIETLETKVAALEAG